MFFPSHWRTFLQVYPGKLLGTAGASNSRVYTGKLLGISKTSNSRVYPGKFLGISKTPNSRVYPGKLPHALMGLALVAVVGLIGCATDAPPPNQPPTAELTSGPIQGGTASYAIEISWTGSDVDGVISRFEYAIDPPSEFSETEISEGGPDISVEIISGTALEPSVTRVSKMVDGKLTFFDWVHTTDSSKNFRFATHEEETDENGPTGRFLGMHAFYVRSVDDDEAVSIPDKVAFTAETVAPESRITRPDITGDFLNTGSTIILEWEGEDPDLPGIDKTPAGFRYKLLKVKTSDFLIIRPPSPDALRKDDSAWIFKPSEEQTVTLEIPEPGAYILGLLAVDENGSVEPFLEWGRNAFAFQAFADIRPTLTLSCEVGVFTSKTEFAIFDMEFPVDTDLNCQLSCSAENYGESCFEFRWGIDIRDVEQEDDWSDWTENPALSPVSFPQAGIHTLYVQARDALGNTSGLVILADVIEFTFDRDVLFVDDSFDQTYPRDSEHDDFWRSLLSGYYDSGQIFEHHVHGLDDRGSLLPQTPTLAMFSRYKLLIWDCSGWGYNGNTALVNATSVDRTLRSYLNAGGKLWLNGRATIAATKSIENGSGDLVYPKEELAPGDFAYDFLKLHTTKVNNDKGADPKNTLSEVQPFPGKPGVYDPMFVDRSKLNPVQASRSGVSHVDAVFDPIFAESENDFRGTLDSLYVYGATGNVFLDPPQSSGYHGRLTALRWHDPDPARKHGRIQWFGFPMYYFFDDQAQDTFNKSMDWFHEESAPAKGS